MKGYQWTQLSRRWLTISYATVFFRGVPMEGMGASLIIISIGSFPPLFLHDNWTVKHYLSAPPVANFLPPEPALPHEYLPVKYLYTDTRSVLHHWVSVTVGMIILTYFFRYEFFPPSLIFYVLIVPLYQLIFLMHQIILHVTNFTFW